MMRVADCTCHLFDTQLQNTTFWPEELFVWAAVILDDVKENGDQYMTHIDDLWKEHYSRLRVLDNSVSDEERKLAVSIILYVPVLMLLTSNDSVHRYMAQQMMHSVSLNYEDWENTFNQLFKACQKMMPKVGEWLNDFMALENDEYLSDEIMELLESENLKPEPLNLEPGTKVYVNVHDGGEFVAQKTVERNVEKVEKDGIGFAEQPKKK